jgi:tRNA A-37 threonylcarbamoyl transferase component Bud32/Leucine-rich repeat (LRR) protein
MATPRPNPSLPGGDNRTRVQGDPPQTQEFSADATSPTFGTPPPGGVPEFPFLSPPQAADELGRLGDYRVLKKLGEGGMGFVFRGEDTVLKRSVALKVMRPEVAAKPQAADRFLREGRAAAGLKSDHIITVYGVGTANGVPYLAMEFLEGLPLDEWIKGQKKAVPLQHALRVVRDTLRGLAVAHEKGLIHRDIKPANLWIEKGTSRIKILDFGLTRGNDGDAQLTQEGAVVGTPAYMAPEQAHGKPVDPRADLFSVGVVFYTLLAGKNPFTRDSLMATLGAVGFETQPPVATVRPDVPAEYSAFLDRLLAKDPAGRPANAKAALQELAAIEKKLADVSKTVATSQPLVAIPLQESAPQVWGELDDEAAPTVRLPKPAAAGPTKPANTKLLLGGGLFAFLLLVGGITIIITNKDGSKTTVEVPDGSKVEVKDGGKTVATVGPRKAAAAKSPVMDADRKAAEFVLANGGAVTIGERQYDPTQAAELPPGPFQCVRIYLPGRELSDAEADMLLAADGLANLSINYPLTEANLARLAKLPAAKSLIALQANAAALTDAGLKQLRDFPQLDDLALSNGRFTGAGLKAWEGWGLKQLGLSRLTDAFQDDNLKYLGKLPNLTSLALDGSGLTDSGVKHIAELSALDNLYLVSDRLSDAGLQPLQKHATLPRLSLGNPQGRVGRLTGAALGVVSGIPNLAEIFLANIPVRDADLKPLLGMAKLRMVNLDQPGEFGDAGLQSLAAIKTLEWACTTGSRVTAEGVRTFKAARPDVKLEGQLFALADPDRAAAEFVLRNRGDVQIDGLPWINADASKLPATPFKCKALRLPVDRVLTDAEIDPLLGLDELDDLEVTHPLTDASLARLAALPGWKRLTAVTIRGTNELTDDGFKPFAMLPNLRALGLGPCGRLKGPGLDALKGLPVERLFLPLGEAFADADLARLKALPKLSHLDLSGSFVSDAGLKHVGELKQLQSFSLASPNATDAGVKHLEGLSELSSLFLSAHDRPGLTTKCLDSLVKLKRLKIMSLGLRYADADAARLVAFEGLEQFGLGGEKFTDAGLLKLADLKTLKVLNVGKSGVTAAGVTAFRKARPDVTVTSDFDNAAAPIPAADPDRAAAEKLRPHFTSITVRTAAGVVKTIPATAPLPAESFVLIRLYFPKAGHDFGGDFVQKELIPALLPLEHLEAIYDPLAAIDFRDLNPKTFAGLACRGSMQKLHTRFPLSDSWIDVLKTFPKLSAVMFQTKGATDDVLIRVRELSSLTHLYLHSYPGKPSPGWAVLTSLPLEQLSLTTSGLFDDAVLRQIAAMKTLTYLAIYDGRLTAAGLETLGKCPSLQRLLLGLKDPIPETGYQHLGNGERPKEVEIKTKQFDDTKLLQFANAKSLTKLDVRDTGVTADGVRKFKVARPDVTLASKFDTATAPADDAPAADPDRAAAAWVIERGGYVRVLGQSQDIKAAADLPADRFTLTFVHLSNRPVSDADLQRLQPLDGLHVLVLGGTQVTDAGLEKLKGFPSLTRLDLGRLPLTDDGMKHLKDLKALRVLGLYAVPVTDAGLEHLKELKYLRTLNVGGTKVTAEAAKAFQQALPDCQVASNGVILERRLVADADRAAAEKLLPVADLDIVPAGAAAKTTLKVGSPVPAGAFAIVAIRINVSNGLPKTYADEVLLPAVAPLTKLTALVDTASRIELSNAHAVKWAAIASWESIQQFELAVPLTNSWFETFRQFPNLTAIHLTNGQSVPAAMLRRLTELKALSAVRIFNLQGGDRWAAVTALPLKRLSPSDTPDLDPAGCERIAAMPDLDTFAIYGAALTPDMLAALAPAPKLRALSVTKCTLPATGIDHIARLPSLYTLTFKVSDFDDARLAQLAGAASLRYLFVKETAVTEAGVTALAAKLPGCTIEWAGGRVKK